MPHPITPAPGRRQGRSPSPSGSRPHGRRVAAALTALAVAVGGGALTGLAAVPAQAAPAPGVGVSAPDTGLSALVNPFVGTESEGNAFPGATAPFGMVQLSPDNTNSYASTSYSKDAGEVWGFSHQHVNSAGCPAAGEVLVTPRAGDAPVTERSAIALKDQATTEQASAGYYTALLADDVEVELTASTRVGEHRYTFPEGATGSVSVNVGQTLRDAGASSVTWVDDRTVEGWVDNGGFCGGTDDSVRYFFSAEFDRPAATHGTWGTDGTFVPASEASAVDVGLNGAAATFDTTTDRTVELSVGVSFVDLDGARGNRVSETTVDGERLGFDAVRASTAAEWDDALGRFDVTTETEGQLRVFYTQLYKSLLSPTIGSDVDGRYLGMDLRQHVADGWTYYQRFSLWDTYRTQATLHALFEHDRAEDVVRSMHRARIEGGWLPRWSLGALETNIMAGDPVSPWLAENFALGTVPDDIHDELWGFLTENATTAPPADVASVGRQSAEFYLANGHVPWYAENGGGLGGQFEEYRHGGSATMEFALADAAIGAAAQRLGKDDEAAPFLERGRNWRTLWNPDVELTGGFTGIVNAVGPDGTFNSAPELAEVQESGFHEGTPWHYQWMAPQDVPGLVDAMGGREAFLARLDQYVDLPALRAAPGVSPASWAEGGSDYYSSIGYNPGNEPMLVDPWLYDFVGEPAKVNDVLAANLNRFPDTPGGGVGNDDLGTLSSWYVLASLGMMPVEPGSGIMAVNAPRVLAATITLDDGAQVSVSAPAASGDSPRYVRGLSVDGVPQTRTWFDATDLQDGAELVFDLASSPEGLTWGTGPDDAVPSVSAPDQAELALAPVGAQPVPAEVGSTVELRLARASLTPVTPAFPESSGVTPTPAVLAAEATAMEAQVEWDDGVAAPATVVPDGDTWLVTTTRAFDVAGVRTATVTVSSSADLPAFAPVPFASASITVPVSVAAAPVLPGDPPGGGGDGAGQGPGAVPGSPVGGGVDGADGSSSTLADRGALAFTGAGPLGALVAAAVTALLLGALLVRRSWRARRLTTR
ncbi:GH92 family glycosyl hydrolase [Frigoribacterium sp. VKM Ac-2530]|uniref:GH92 family glycosyl hydrolase n=1 Tax=Frigoribacterium sp. VKM Ac-2530 TaxID=2783822 RepID=UPI00188D06AC|nr:GH92 family glycosyl hydrolase [Frigoribacterium sp. VKM Ac-2530]MBF4578520.1 GH92 family glycosyl hydrolase [Frigoribacterium sp. VKM Ac-2530]